LFELDLAALQQRDVPAATPVPRHQPAWRDVALVLRDAVGHDAVVEQLASDPSGLVRAVTLFDVYRPKQPGAELRAGERSLAFRLELLGADANLTDERIDAAVQAAVERVRSAFGARLRG
jgi:phenylalanyl-tRNA synthetase beta chain